MIQGRTSESGSPSTPTADISDRPDAESGTADPEPAEEFTPVAPDRGSIPVTPEVPRFVPTLPETTSEEPVHRVPVEPARPVVMPSVDRSATSDQFAPVREGWLPADAGQFAFPPAVGRPEATDQIAAPDDKPAVEGGSPEEAEREPAGPENSPGSVARIREGDAASAAIPATETIPPIHRSQTTMLKLDPVQAAWLGSGILLCLSCQIVIIVVLARQRNGQPQLLIHSAAAGKPADRWSPATNRNTAVVDFDSDASLWDGIGATGDGARNEHKQRETMIIEELVSKNVKLAAELSQC